MAWVYLLRCADGLYYVGSTRNLDGRMDQHHRGQIGFTSRRKPIELIWCLECDLADAYVLERRLHGWSRAKKEALAEGRLDLLPGLSANRQNVARPDTRAG